VVAIDLSPTLVKLAAERYAQLPQTGAGRVQFLSGDMLADALGNALRERNLQWKGEATPKLVLAADIVEYEAGDAFKRWLLPGWGATVLVVRGTLVDAESRKVGSVEAKRTVEAGGGYTIGAWETIFRDVANDIVTRLGEQLK